MKILKFVLCLLFGLMFINAGLDKFLHYMPVPEMNPEMAKVMEAFMLIKWLIPLVGFIEIVGGVLFIFPRTRALGALVILPVMVGIFLHNIVFAPEGLVFAGILLLINSWIIFDNREKYNYLLS